jgi:hypothetical protein
MRYFFARRPPPFTRMLVVESGSRRILEEGIPRFRAIFGDGIQMDLLTCLPGLPRVLDPSTSRVFRVTQCRNGADRRRLLAEVRSRRYPLLAMICSDEPVMTPWKLAAALVAPAKVLIFNENSDFFWLDWRHRRAIRQFALFRAGLLEDDAARKLAQLAAFPFILGFLLLYAGWVHLARFFRLALMGRRPAR